MSSISLPLALTMTVVPPVDNKKEQQAETKLTPENKKVLECAAMPKHLGAATAKILRGWFSSGKAEVDRLKDDAKHALAVYNHASTEENKNKFIQAFQVLDARTPDAEFAAANPSWGPQNNPAHQKFIDKTEKLRAAYKILTTPQSES